MVTFKQWQLEQIATGHVWARDLDTARSVYHNLPRPAEPKEPVMRTAPVAVAPRPRPPAITAKTIGTAVGQLLAEQRRGLMDEITQLRQQVQLMRAELDAVTTIKRLADGATAALQGRQAQVDRIERRLDLMLSDDARAQLRQ